MNIEVVGAGTQNKGAELLLLAVKQHYEMYGSQVRLAVNPWFGSFEDRAHYGLLQKVEPMRWGRSRVAFNILPKSFRAAYGMLTEEEIGAVIDVSGFAFGDQHPTVRTLRFADDAARWRRQGKAVILLPQALGPFANPTIRDGFMRIVDNVDVVYARDHVSYEHAYMAVGSSEKILLAPDITIGIQPYANDISRDPEGKVGYVVPNSRMLDKVSKDIAGRYIPFLARCMREIEANGYQTRLLLHDTGEDYKLVSALQQELSRNVEVVQEPDPYKLKVLIGGAHLLVGSRFHSLVGALSQGVPAVALGWSHKYDMLMADFGCPDMILAPSDSEDRIGEVINRSVIERTQITQVLQQARTRMVEELKVMWQKVDGLLGLAAAASMQSS